MNTYRVVALAEPSSDIGTIDMTIYADSIDAAKMRWEQIADLIGINTMCTIAQVN